MNSPRILFALLAAGFPMLPGSAAEWLKPEKDGRIAAAGVEWEIACFDQAWKPSFHREGLSANMRQTGDRTEWAGTFRAAGRIWESRQELVQEAGSAHFRWDLVPDSPAEVKVLAWEGHLSAAAYKGLSIAVGGEEIILPESPKEGGETILMKRADKIRIPARGGFLELRGNWRVQVVDRRTHRQPFFAVRLFFEPGAGELREAHLEAALEFQPYRTGPVDLGPACNRALADEKEGDGVGGWTDQGPESDLRQFAAGDLNFGGIRFSVPAEGKAAIVLSGDKTHSPSSAAESGVIAPVDGGAAYLYLLHAAAWLGGETTGKILCEYRDGHEETIDVKRNRDVSNWWNPGPCENASVVWRGKTKDAESGVFLSRFPLAAGRQLARIGFRAEGANVWMILGAATSADPIPLPRPETYVFRRGPDWQPIADSLAILPGSVLDWSGWSPAGPAGASGPLRADEDGHFYYENKPGERVKIFGTSVNFSVNFPDKKNADFLARTFRQNGYNSIRFHHYDVSVAGGWNADRYVIDAGKADLLDYFFYRCKEEGLGIATELFTIRRITSPAVREKMGGDFQAFKALVPVMPEAMEEWKRFASDFLGHRNPYTGLTWAEDPALLAVVPVNEDTAWVGLRDSPELQAVYEKAFGGWLAEKKIRAEDGPGRTVLFNEFVAEAQIAADREMARFLREEVGFRGLVSGNNWQKLMAQVPIRAELDYVDNHSYWDHPTFSGDAFRYPFNHSLRSATAALAGTPRELFLTRVQGKPFAVTEFNYSFPNPFRSEGGALMGAYAARQDWDLLYRFAWAHELEDAISPSPAGAFDLARDPLNRLSERFIGALWFRGDMSPFGEEATFVVNRDLAFSGKGVFAMPDKFPENATYVGLKKRVASRFEAAANGVPSPEFREQTEEDRFDVWGGGCRTVIERGGDFYAQTPSSRAMVLQTRSLDEGFVSGFSGGPASVLVAAMDGKPLDVSGRLLVIHLTDVISEETVFADERKANVMAPGKLPHLVRQGRLEVHIPNSVATDSAKVFAVGLDGARLGDVPFTAEGNSLDLVLETIPENGPTRMVYEILR